MIEWFTLSIPYPTWEFWKYWFLAGLCLTPVLVIRFSQLKNNKGDTHLKSTRRSALFAGILILTLAPIMIVPVLFGLIKNRKSALAKRKRAREEQRKNVYNTELDELSEAIETVSKHLH